MFFRAMVRITKVLGLIIPYFLPSAINTERKYPDDKYVSI